MRQLSKIDVILHKVGINTPCFIYWSKPKAEKVSRMIDYLNRYFHYKRLCWSKDFDFTGEYDIYINRGMSPAEAFNKTFEEWINK